MCELWSREGRDFGLGSTPHSVTKATKQEDDSKLSRWLRMMGIRPMRFYAAICRSARAMSIPPISERQFLRVYGGGSNATSKTILLCVAAARSLSQLPVRASDLFDIEPELATLTGNLLVGHPDPARGATSQLSVFWRPRHLRLGGPGTVHDEHSAATPSDTLEKLYREHGPVMVAYARVQWSLDTADAEAVVHDIFLSLLERQPDVINERGFLLGATRNACKHYWRKRGRETELPEDLADAVESRRQEQWPLVTTVVAALSHLGPRCREVLHSFYIGNEEVAEIAKRFDITPEYVYHVLVSCRRRLREIVSDSGERVA